MFGGTSNSGKWSQVSSDEIRLTYSKGKIKTATIKMNSNKKTFSLGWIVYRRVGNRHSN